MESGGLKSLSLSCFVSPLHLLRCNRVPHFLSPLLFNPCVSPLLFSSSSASPRCSVQAQRSQLNSLPQPLGLAVNGFSHSHKTLLQVVLFSPQIPGNTGTIARTCAASGVGLHLIEPLGFQVDDAKLKRAGLDYWPYVVVKIHGSWGEFKDHFMQQEGEKRLLAFTKRGGAIHSDFSYRPGDWLVFGSETSGLPQEILSDCKSETLGGGTIRIPMIETYVRCLNLSVSVGISVYEASRQLNYEQIQLASEPSAIDRSVPLLTEDIFS